MKRTLDTVRTNKSNCKNTVVNMTTLKSVWMLQVEERNRYILGKENSLIHLLANMDAINQRVLVIGARTTHSLFTVFVLLVDS